MGHSLPASRPVVVRACGRPRPGTNLAARNRAPAWRGLDRRQLYRPARHAPGRSRSRHALVCRRRQASAPRAVAPSLVMCRCAHRRSATALQKSRTGGPTRSVAWRDPGASSSMSKQDTNCRRQIATHTGILLAIEQSPDDAADGVHNIDLGREFIHHRADAVIETQRVDGIAETTLPVRVFDTPKGAVTMDAAQSDGYAAAIAVANSWWTRPKQGGGLAVAQCSRALRLAVDAVSPAATTARFHALIAAAPPQSLGCPGVYPRLPNESAATLCSMSSPRRLEDGRRAPPDGSNRSSSRRRRAFTSSPSGGSAGFLQGCP